MKLPCEITRDLLPLYAEHLTCPETNRLVEEHLSTCPACQEELHAIQLPMPVQPDPQPDAPLKKIRAALRRKGILTALLSILAVVCLFWLSAWMYTAQSPATAEQSGLWTYNRKENGANVCILEVQGDGVWLTMDTPFNWGEENITVRAVRYRFPQFHATLEGLFGSTASSNSITVSNTQLITVVCADATLHYRQGQPVYAYRVNGSIVYGTEEQLHLYPRA